MVLNADILDWLIKVFYKTGGGMKKQVLPLETDKMRILHYKIYIEKKEELQNFINKEVVTWGGYANIPNYIQKVIDKELIAIGKYAKKVNIQEAEDRPSSVKLI